MVSQSVDEMTNDYLSGYAVTIETGRLLLRPWKSDDAKECFKNASDPEIGPNAGWQVDTSIEDTMQIIGTVLSAPETYAVVLKDTGLPIGSVGIKRGKDSAAITNSKEAESGCWVGKPYWNNGDILIVQLIKWYNYFL